MELSQHLAELLSVEERDALFLTVYLDTSVSSGGVRTFPVFLRKRIGVQERLVEHRAGDAAVREFRQNVSRVEEYLTYKLAADIQGCAIFSSVGRDYFKGIQLPVPLQNKLSVSNAPSLDQLIELRQRSRHYAVVTIDQHSGRIFSLFMQEVESPIQERAEGIPRRSKAGGWSQMRQQRHRQDKIEQFLRTFGERLTRFLESQRVEGVILLGTQENVAEFLKQVPSETARQVLVTSSIPAPESEEAIIDKSLSLLSEFEQKRGGKLVSRLYERLCQDYQAVVGLEDTLFQLQVGRVERLFLGPSFEATGRCCQNCGFCFSGDEKVCTYCQGELRPVDLRDRVAKIAEQRQVPLELVAEVTFLDSLGGAGALLLGARGDG